MVLDNVALKDLLEKMVTPAARREAVAHLRSAHEMSERRAIRVIGADRSAVRYRSTKPDDAAVRDRLKSLALERRRFGYRRLHVLLRRDGHWKRRRPRTCAEAWTSWPTSSLTVDGSEFWRCMTTAPGNAWPSSPHLDRRQLGGPRTRRHHRHARKASGITSPPAGLNRRASAKASMSACGTSA